MKPVFEAPFARSTVLALLMVAQSSLGLILQNQYRDAAWIRATWFGNDWVTLVVAVPLLITSMVLASGGSLRGRLLWCGVLGYAVYNYAYYLLGAALNVFFPLYAVVLVLAATTFGSALRRTDAQQVASSYRAGTPVRGIGAYFVFVALGLASVWLAMWAAYAFAGKPTPIEPEAFKLVAALDLTVMVPALLASGVLLWRKMPWGYLCAPIAGVQAALYLLVLSVNSAVAIYRGRLPAPGEVPLWGTLMVLTAGATGLLLASASQRQPTHPAQQAQGA